MEKSELISKMKEELKNYQIGLHNVSINRYYNFVANGGKRGKQIELTGALVSEKAIAKNILTMGLYVADKSHGMLSTVLPTKNVCSDFFDFGGWCFFNFYENWTENTIWNVIVAIPYVINYDGKYFIGNITNYTLSSTSNEFNIARYNIANNYLFNSVIPREFIYGFYGRKIERDNQGKPFFSDVSEDIAFFENPCFFEKLDKEKQHEVVRRLLKNKKRVLANLKLANDYNNFDMPFRTSRERDIINATKRQRMDLCYKK